MLQVKKVSARAAGRRGSSAFRVPGSAFLRLPGMLMVGSAGRNSGKTELACSLIRRAAARQDVVGVKVTAVREKDGTCPRGGEGCGACSSLEGSFCITEETDGSTDKDTSRLLAAGARRVFWLRVLTEFLPEGVEALTDIIGGNTVSVCESNSLRTVVDPDLFLIVREEGSSEVKASARAVMDRADRIVVSDGHRFDLDLNDVGTVDGRWILCEHAAAIVLAGGVSRRMGTDKSMLRVHDRPMIAHVCDQLRGHFEETLVSAADAASYGFLGLPIVPDRAPGRGPLMGIASALEASTHELSLVVACDIPEIDVVLARRMLAMADGYDAVVPRVHGGHLEPLFAVYRKSAGAAIDALLEEGECRVRRVFERCKTRFLDVTGTSGMRNLNTMEEFRGYVGHGHPDLR